MNRLLVPAVLVLFLIASSAHASDSEMYFSGNFGISLLSDSANDQAGIVLESGYDPGFNAGIALGYDFGDFRAEGEVAYHSNDLDTITAGAVSVPGEGTVSALSFMANGYYDFSSRKSFRSRKSSRSRKSWVVPYLGIGVGFAKVDADMSIPGFGGQFIDDSAIVLAYQFMAGVGFDISSKTTLTVGYRYFATTNPQFDDLSGVSFDSEYQVHNINVGIRVAF
jgi:opacity protein-like surface antigen